MASNQSEWLRFRDGSPPVCQILAFHPASGSAGFFASLAVQLPPELELVAFQLPGRGRRLNEPAQTHMADVVASIGAGLPPMRVPTIFLGHSLGAYVAFELCHWLRQETGILPRQLIVSSASAPSAAVRGSRLLSELDDERLAATIASWGVSDPSFSDPEFRELVLATARCDLKIAETYRCEARPNLALPITAWTGDQDSISDQQLAAWREYGTGVTVEHFSGGHDHLRRPSPAHLQALIGIAKRSA
ncbi:MAG: thioesterase [Deltaproteobacteria bacterium]|nr:thioesterase [Deltaproteobacteria bacterium]